MQLAPIIERLKAEVQGFKRIGGAADVAALDNGPIQTPALFVLPLSESAESNALIGTGFHQRVEAQFSVMFVLANKRDARGGAAVDDLWDMRLLVRAALAGWTPDAFDPIDYRAGRLVSFNDGLLWWADEYSTAYHYRLVK